MHDAWVNKWMDGRCDDVNDDDDGDDDDDDDDHIRQIEMF